MAKTREFNGGYAFVCPGCGEEHHITKSWGFNGNFNAPTFTPSVLVRSGHFASHHKDGDFCWCTHNAERISAGREPSKFKCQVCHSFVSEGKIQFLGDCTHNLAGQTVDLPECP